MARPKEHNIQRKLWNTPISENGQLKNGLFAAMNWNTMNYALNNDYIKNNEAYVSFYKSHQSLIKYMSILANQYETIRNTLDIEHTPFTTSDAKAAEKIPNKLSRVQEIINVLPTDINANKTQLKEITTRDLFDFFKYIYGVGIVLKDLVKIFGDEITKNDEISFSNPKDNLSTRCSDNIVLFNLAIYVYIEKNTETQQIPFKILNNDMYTNILLGYSEARKPIDNLLIIWHNLKKECAHSIPLSTECLYSFLFYCHTSNTYKQLNSHIQSYKELFGAVSSLIQKNTVASLQTCCPPNLFDNLYLTLLAPFSGKYLQDGENIATFITKTRYELKNQKDIFFKEIAQYQSLYNELITEYVKLAPDIVKQMEFEEASNEIATIDNELYEWADELLDLLENNNVSRFLSLINTYNRKKIDDQIILVIFNLLFLDNTISDCLITIFEHKKKYNVSEFPSNELLADNTLTALKNFLNYSTISYKHLDLLTLIDYNTLAKKEWDFLLNLPSEQESEQNFLSSFLQIIIAYRGTAAFTTVNDVYKHFFPCE